MLVFAALLFWFWLARWLLAALLLLIDLLLECWLLHFNMEEKLKRSSAAAINYSSCNLEFS